jgi:hypothetical protein
MKNKIKFTKWMKTQIQGVQKLQFSVDLSFSSSYGFILTRKEETPQKFIK